MKDTFYEQSKTVQMSIIKFYEALNDLEWTINHKVSEDEYKKSRKERNKLVKKYKKYIKNN